MNSQRVASHISGDGFPAVTSSPPIMTEKDSFQPITGNNEKIKLAFGTPKTRYFF